LTIVDREQSQFQPAANTQLTKNMAKMMFNSDFADGKTLGDSLVG
jgi:hypothetical protein